MNSVLCPRPPCPPSSTGVVTWNMLLQTGNRRPAIGTVSGRSQGHSHVDPCRPRICEKNRKPEAEGRAAASPSGGTSHGAAGSSECQMVKAVFKRRFTAFRNCRTIKRKVDSTKPGEIKEVQKRIRKQRCLVVTSLEGDFRRLMCFLGGVFFPAADPPTHVVKFVTYCM